MEKQRTCGERERPIAQRRPAFPAAPQGRLRLLYECNPLAFIAEQAGGLATDGKQRILDIQPTELHQRVGFYIGSKLMVEKAMGL